MEEQAKGLREFLGTDKCVDATEIQLKELYDSLNEEDEKEKAELSYLREQQAKVNELLDNLKIPNKGTKTLSLYERVELALERSLTA